MDLLARSLGESIIVFDGNFKKSIADRFAHERRVIHGLSAKTATSSGSSLSKSRTISVTNVVKSGCEVNGHRCRYIYLFISEGGAR